MKRVIFAAAAAAAVMGMAAPAAAQDANARGWGCSLGGGFAETWQNSKFTQIGKAGSVAYVANGGGPRASAAFGSQSPDAIGYHIRMNCDWHNGPWVIGAAIQHSNGLAGTNVVTAYPTYSIRASLQSLETVTGRVGYMVTPDLLAYARTGVAVAFNSYNAYANSTSVSPAPATQIEFAQTRNVGFVLGGGLEWTINKDWSIYGEFDHNNFGSFPYPFTLAVGQTGQADTIRIRQSVNQLLIGVNFHF